MPAVQTVELDFIGSTYVANRMDITDFNAANASVQLRILHLQKKQILTSIHSPDLCRRWNGPGRAFPLIGKRISEFNENLLGK
jgi:hypothetical protein